MRFANVVGRRLDFCSSECLVKYIDRVGRKVELVDEDKDEGSGSTSRRWSS